MGEALGPNYESDLGGDTNVAFSIIADNFSKARWSWGWVSGVDCDGRTIFIADEFAARAC
jgi:hypothetical protein